MTEARWERVYALYEAAIELSGDERAALVQAEHVRDPDTAGEVVRLLQLHESAGDFLERSPAGLLSFHALPPTFSRGELVGNRFVVEEQIGAGGMGEVFRAHDRELGVKIAIKTVRPERLGDSAAQERLRREALVARQVTHRNVCRIFDVFRHRSSADSDEVVVLAMELLEGPTLRQHLAAKGPLPEREALEIALQLCDGLQAAHEQGVVHQDLKPANVILTGEAGEHRAVITDFGLARPLASASESHSLTEVGVPAGTLDYMAPELLRGSPATVRSDLYALGVLLFEMVTGALPHHSATNIAQLLKRFLEPAPSPRAATPSVSRKWDAVTRQCLDRDPGLRPASAARVGRALRGVSPMGAHLNRRSFVLGTVGASAAGLSGVAWWSSRPVRVIMFAVENRSGDPASNYLCQGTTAELTRRLAAMPGLRIAPYHDAKPAAPHSFPASYTLAGSMPNPSTLTLELADAGDGSVLWTQQFDRSRYRSPMDFQNDVASAVARQLQKRRPARAGLAAFFDSRSTAADPPTQNADAFDLYMRAAALLRDRTLAQSLSAIEHLEHALALDPHFALAYTAMAEAHIGLIDYAYAPTAELLLRGHGYAERGVREGPSLAETHLVLAAFRQMAWDWDGAAESYRESLRLRPNFSRAMQWYAGQRLQFGSTREILADMKQALELDPYDPSIRAGYSLGLFFSDRYAEAIQVQEASATLRNSIMARQQIGNVYAYQASISSGWRQTELFRLAMAQAASVDDLENRPEAPAATGMRQADRMYSLYHALAGNAAAAAPYLERLESQMPAGLTSPATIARAYAALGKPDRALDLIELAVRRKDRVLLYLKVSPFFRPLHPHARFQQFLRIMQL
jgi:serine/threonine protein kinase/tetratricopeptide (TPR) repeat protein